MFAKSMLTDIKVTGHSDETLKTKDLGEQKATVLQLLAAIVGVT